MTSKSEVNKPLIINPLTAVTAIWRFDVITHAAIHQTCLDKFLTSFDTQCAYSKIYKRHYNYCYCDNTLLTYFNISINPV